jgi:hypothetical protein
MESGMSRHYSREGEFDHEVDVAGRLRLSMGERAEQTDPA